MSIDIRPRGIWTGLTVPGKKMVSLITQTGGSYRGQLLIDLYKEPPEHGIRAVVFALHEVPKQGVRYGPAFRDAPVRLSASTVSYGTILTDIRDFLKLRFRLNVEDVRQLPLWEVLGDVFRDGSQADIGSAFESLTEDQSILGLGYLMAHVISELDSLSRLDQRASLDGIEERVLRLRDVFRAWLGWLDPVRYDQEFDRQFQDTDVDS